MIWLYLLAGVGYTALRMRFDRQVLVRWCPPDQRAVAPLVGRVIAVALMVALWPLYLLAAAAPPPAGGS